MTTAYVFTIDGYTFPRDEVPARGPIVEQPPQRWSKQDVLGAGAPGTIMTFLGYKSQEWEYTSRASAATVNKLKAIYSARKEVTFTTPQNTTGFKVIMERLFVPHEEPIEDGKYLCRFTLVSRAPVSSDVPAEQEEDVPTIIVKTSAQTINSSSTLTNDTELFFAAGANEKWVGNLHLAIAIKSLSDFKGYVNHPAGALTYHWVHGPSFAYPGNRATIAQIGDSFFTVSSDSNKDVGVVIDFTVWMGGTSGNIQFQWCQNLAVAEDTIVDQLSYLIAWKQ